MKLKKEDFVKILSTMTPQQINELIENKGKEPKLVSAIVFLSD